MPQGYYKWDAQRNTLYATDESFNIINEVDQASILGEGYYLSGKYLYGPENDFGDALNLGGYGDINLVAYKNGRIGITSAISQRSFNRLGTRRAQYGFEGDINLNLPDSELKSGITVGTVVTAKGKTVYAYEDANNITHYKDLDPQSDLSFYFNNPNLFSNFRVATARETIDRGLIHILTRDYATDLESAYKNRTLGEDLNYDNFSNYVKTLVNKVRGTFSFYKQTSIPGAFIPDET